MRRFLPFTFVCTLTVFTTFAHAQQINVAVGGSTLFSPNRSSASLAYPPPAEKGGDYPSASAEILFSNNFGFQVDAAFRYHRELYNGYQQYRPILYDVNAVFAPKLSPKVRADFMGGVGVQTLVFYNPSGSCSSNGGSCPLYINSNHFLVHLSADARYYFWRNFFVRPEAHYYRIVNNFEFHSDNVLRLGASVGYTFGSR